MAKPLRLGILTPSSNTSLEPLTSAIIADLPGVTVHFSRFSVTKISLEKDALAQFTLDKILASAQLLADAKVDIIGWSGTSSGWLGFEADEELCDAIKKATGIPATTSVLALNKAIAIYGLKEVGLVTPYLNDVQNAIIANYATIGVDMTKEDHLGKSTNTDFGAVSEETLDKMMAKVAAMKVPGITTFCTNLYAAQRVAYWEETHGIIVLDTVTTVVWDMLRYLKVDSSSLAKKWGKLLAQV